mmetsp:Transcript_10040/g.9979  ORF Transcript_10040/g.9979 Transcript_10040/m.9979 type:complete len:144 (-) Transcript_10040:386-817(-)
MTQGSGGTTESALEWISEHQEDADFLEELVIVGQSEEKPKSTLSKEEKLKKAKELQEQIRKRRVEEDKRNAEVSEKNRILATKQLQIAKRQMDEQQQKIQIEQNRREKEEFNRAKQQMLDQLKRDKEERFGKKFAGEAAVVQS